MYTTKDTLHWNDTCMPPPTLHKPCHFIKVVVGARNCGDWGEPLHICEVLRRHHFGTEVNIMNHFTGDLENNSNLCNLMTCIPITCADTMILPKLTSDVAALRFTVDKHSIKSGWNQTPSFVLLFRPNLDAVNDLSLIQISELVLDNVDMDLLCLFRVIIVSSTKKSD